MNSKQRRRDERKWRYQVEIPYEKASRNDYDTMFDWCQDMWGNGRKCAGWREKHGHVGTCWQFTSEEKAVLFAMRWR